jgi:hypothetical protein
LNQSDFKNIEDEIGEKKKRKIALPVVPPQTMNQGYSGGFFLPAQRSIHCKGGFFSSDSFSQQHPIPTNKKLASSNASTPVPSSKHMTATATSNHFIRPQHEKVMFTLLCVLS